MSDLKPMPQVRPHFWSAEIAQEFLATKFVNLTPWLCAQRARAFLYLARRKGIMDVMGRNYWRSARAFVLLGRRMKKHGPWAAVFLPSDFTASDRFLKGDTSIHDVQKVKEDLFAATQIGSARQALDQLDEIAERCSELRAKLVASCVTEQLRENRRIEDRVKPPRPFIPTKLSIRPRREAA